MINIGIKRDGTSSTLFTKIDLINNLLVSEINNDAMLKKFMLFLTKSPLENKSEDYNGNIIYQYDLPNKLTEKVTYCTSKPTATTKTYRTSEQCLFPYPSESDKITGEYPMMFVYNYAYDMGRTYSNPIATNIYKIDILIPLKYMPLYPYGESRLHKIMERLAYLFDKVSLDDESKLLMGDLDFRLVNRSIEEKINKTNDIIVTSLYIETQLIGARTDYTEGILR